MKRWRLSRVGPLAPVLVLGGLVMVFALFASQADARRAQEHPALATLAARAAAAAKAAPADTTGRTPDTSAAGQPAPQEPATLPYQREFFDYDATGRRDPFKPLLDVDSELQGPRFDELALTGIFKGEDGEGMVVVEDSRRKGYFLKRGDLVGKATLIDIGSEEAVFEVRDYGISRRETLKLQRPEETP
jgi:hypothetical protein